MEIIKISDRADWRYAQIKIKGPSSATSDEHLKRYKNATFSFIATRGISYLSDIAIDDIMLQVRDRTLQFVISKVGCPKKFKLITTSFNCWCPTLK